MTSLHALSLFIKPRRHVIFQDVARSHHFMEMVQISPIAAVPVAMVIIQYQSINFFHRPRQTLQEVWLSAPDCSCPSLFSPLPLTFPRCTWRTSAPYLWRYRGAGVTANNNVLDGRGRYEDGVNKQKPAYTMFVVGTTTLPTSTSLLVSGEHILGWEPKDPFTNHRGTAICILHRENCSELSHQRTVWPKHQLLRVLHATVQI